MLKKILASSKTSSESVPKLTTVEAAKRIDQYNILLDQLSSTSNILANLTFDFLGMVLLSDEKLNEEIAKFTPNDIFSDTFMELLTQYKNTTFDSKEQEDYIWTLIQKLWRHYEIFFEKNELKSDSSFEDTKELVTGILISLDLNKTLDAEELLSPYDVPEDLFRNPTALVESELIPLGQTLSKQHDARLQQTETIIFQLGVLSCSNCSTKDNLDIIPPFIRLLTWIETDLKSNSSSIEHMINEQGKNGEQQAKFLSAFGTIASDILAIPSMVSSLVEIATTIVQNPDNLTAVIGQIYRQPHNTRRQTLQLLEEITSNQLRRFNTLKTQFDRLDSNMTGRVQLFMITAGLNSLTTLSNMRSQSAEERNNISSIIKNFLGLEGSADRSGINLTLKTYPRIRNLQDINRMLNLIQKLQHHLKGAENLELKSLIGLLLFCCSPTSSQRLKEFQKSGGSTLLPIFSLSQTQDLQVAQEKNYTIANLYGQKVKAIHKKTALDGNCMFSAWLMAEQNQSDDAQHPSSTQISSLRQCVKEWLSKNLNTAASGSYLLFEGNRTIKDEILDEINELLSEKNKNPNKFQGHPNLWYLSTVSQTKYGQDTQDEFIQAYLNDIMADGNTLSEKISSEEIDLDIFVDTIGELEMSQALVQSLGNLNETEKAQLLWACNSLKTDQVVSAEKIKRRVETTTYFGTSTQLEALRALSRDSESTPIIIWSNSGDVQFFGAIEKTTPLEKVEQVLSCLSSTKSKCLVFHPNQTHYDQGQFDPAGTLLAALRIGFSELSPTEKTKCTNLVKNYLIQHPKDLTQLQTTHETNKSNARYRNAQEIDGFLSQVNDSLTRTA